MDKQGTEYNKIPTRPKKIENDEAVNEKKVYTSPITTGNKIKKPLIKRIGGAIFGGGEDGGGFLNYLTKEIIIPSIQNIIVESVQNGIQMIVYGERRGPSNRYYDNRSNYTNYQNAYRSKYSSSRPVQSFNSGFESYEIETRRDAELVRDTLIEISDSYGVVSVADYYTLINVKSNYTDNDYGWDFETISRTVIVAVDGGRSYRLNLPRPERIRK